MIGRKLPNVTFRTRVRDESIEGPNPFKWENKTTDDYFKGKRVVLFSLPGAFTPTCSTYQLPDFDKLSGDFKAKGIDEIYCLFDEVTGEGLLHDAIVRTQLIRATLHGVVNKEKVRAWIKEQCEYENKLCRYHKILS